MAIGDDFLVDCNVGYDLSRYDFDDYYSYDGGACVCHNGPVDGVHNQDVLPDRHDVHGRDDCARDRSHRYCRQASGCGHTVLVLKVPQMHLPAKTQFSTIEIEIFGYCNVILNQSSIPYNIFMFD